MIPRTPAHVSCARVMGRAYNEIRWVPNEITYSTACVGNETIDKD